MNWLFDELQVSK